MKNKNFIHKAKGVHDNKYDYSMANYINHLSPVKIICHKHGMFKQIPSYHLSGNGCQKCSQEKLGNTKEKFVEKARKIHGNKYDYSLVEYVSYKIKVDIICKKHYVFRQSPKSHLSGYGCRLCGIDLISLNTNKFIEKANRIHKNKYDYSMTKYVNSNLKIIITCKKHGEFKQRPHSHLSGNGCKKCHIESTRSNTNEFIEKANRIHKNKYDYSETKYVRAFDDVTIICSKHGEFKQRANSHISNSEGCPKCATIISKQHQSIINHMSKFVDVEINDRKVISPFELDVYVPSHKMAIEIHGLYWHSYGKNEVNDKYRHYNKHNLCKDKNIRLFQIFENEIIDNFEIVKSRINNLIGLSTRVSARKCITLDIDNVVYKDFINNNHLQGYKSSSIKLGLFYNGELMSVMSFNKHPKYQWEITRFANKINYTVVGGANKLFKYFMRKHDPISVLTFADRRYSDGGLYHKMGFELDSITKPNYFYVKGCKIFSRQQFQKHKLHKKLDIFDENLSEIENMLNNGYRRIWDAGHYKYVMKMV